MAESAKTNDREVEIYSIQIPFGRNGVGAPCLGLWKEDVSLVGGKCFTSHLEALVLRSWFTKRPQRRDYLDDFFEANPSRELIELTLLERNQEKYFGLGRCLEMAEIRGKASRLKEFSPKTDRRFSSTSTRKQDLRSGGGGREPQKLNLGGLSLVFAKFWWFFEPWALLKGLFGLFFKIFSGLQQILVRLVAEHFKKDSWCLIFCASKDVWCPHTWCVSFKGETRSSPNKRQTQKHTWDPPREACCRCFQCRKTTKRHLAASLRLG